MSENETPVEDLPARVETLEENVTSLDTRVASLQSLAAVAGEDVIYRPPLWSQESAYSAADDRRLVLSAFWPGVIDQGDLQVTPRQEGANLSVDVLPGHVVVPGTEQADQGHYLCPLAQRVNIPIAAGPAAGNIRADKIIARVYEPVGEEAYWRLEPLSSNVVPAGTDPTWPPAAPSSVTLATVGPIATATNQITAPMIIDYRHMARPGSMGSTFVKQRSFGDLGWNQGVWTSWGLVELPTPPHGLPIDVEARIEGVVLSSAQYDPTTIQGQVIIAAGGHTTPSWIKQSVIFTATSPNGHTYVPVSRTLVADGVTLDWPDHLWAEVVVRIFPGYPAASFAGGVLTLRVSPSGGVLAPWA